MDNALYILEPRPTLLLRARSDQLTTERTTLNENRPRKGAVYCLINSSVEGYRPVIKASIIVEPVVTGAITIAE